MQPTWARKFEPPAICGLESEDAIDTLMKVYIVTGDKKLFVFGNDLNIFFGSKLAVVFDHDFNFGQCIKPVRLNCNVFRGKVLMLKKGINNINAILCVFSYKS